MTAQLPAPVVEVAVVRQRRRWLPPGARIAIAWAVAAVGAVLLVTYNNRLPYGSVGFWTIVESRFVQVATIVIVAFCQAVATVVFHTATSNRILTPSIMGFDALYRVMQTGIVFLFGAGFLAQTDGLLKIALQSVLMIGLATALYGLLLGRGGNLHVMLLVGVVLGTGLGALSTFMQRILTPSEFDILTARLFGNLSNSDVTYLPWAALVCIVVGVTLWLRRNRLDVLALGREPSINLGIAHRREMVICLMLVAVLISVSTTLVGPMTFFGFLVAMITYQLAGTCQHKYVLPLAAGVGTATLMLAYFVLRHVFYASGVISVIIEFVGGIVFLVFILRKGLR